MKVTQEVLAPPEKCFWDRVADRIKNGDGDEVKNNFAAECLLEVAAHGTLPESVTMD